MKRSGNSVDDDSSEDEMLTFRNKYELRTYMQNRLLELGFDVAVSNALRDMFTELDRLQGLCIIC